MSGMKYLLLFLALAFGLAGCAGPELKIPPIAASENPSDQIFALEETLAKGRAEQVDVLAPTWYTKAESYLDQARYGLAHNNAPAAILEDIAYGHAHFNKAREYARIARSTIPEAIKARDLAIAAGAAVFSQDFQDMEDLFISLTMDIENNYLKRAEKNQPRVAQGYADLELRAIKEKTLGEVRTLLSEAENNGAERIAPKIYTLARKALNDADRFITEQRYEREAMQKKANFALFQAQRVGQIMALSNKLGNMSPEDIALWSEARLHQITAQLGASDLRNEPTELQLENIIQSVIALKDDNASLKELRQQDAAEYQARIAKLQAELESQRQQVAELEGQSKAVQEERERIAQQRQEAQARLEAERRFQKRFDEVQSLFAAGQAEVYKQGNNLVIRLKAMRFPVGKDLIMPDNYALLSQVRNAIRIFDQAQVVIEGHTDSTGSAAINEQLSQKRAEAVRQYFIASEALRADQVTAIGYGSERPLAPNDSAVGRAINRRIDVLIKTAEPADQQD